MRYNLGGIMVSRIARIAGSNLALGAIFPFS